MNNKQKLKQKKIITIAKLKSLNIKDQRLFDSILKGNISTLKIIVNKKIKGIPIEKKSIISNLIKQKSFLKSLPYEQKMFLVFTLDNWVKSEFRNNPNNVKFQKILSMTLKELHASKNIFLNSNLPRFLIEKYGTKIEEKEIVEIKLINKTHEGNLEVLRQLLFMIDNINMLNNLTKTQRIRMFKNIDFEGNLIDQIDNLAEYVNEYGLGEIYDNMEVKNGIIENKALLHEIKEEIKAYKNEMYQLKFGINYSDKNDSKNSYYNQVLPYELSGKTTIKENDLESLNYLIIWIKTEKNLKTWLNRLYSNQNVNIIDHGCTLNYTTKIVKILPKTKTDNLILDFKEKKTQIVNYEKEFPYYIVYQYKISENMENMINQLYLKTIKQHFLTSNTPTLDKLNDISFTFDYSKQLDKIKAYNKNYRKFQNMRNYQVFLPTYNNDKYLYCSFGHPCVQETTLERNFSKLNKNGVPIISKTVKVKQLSFKLGNINNTYYMRNKMNTEIRLIFEYLSVISDNFKKHESYRNNQFIEMIIKDYILDNQVLSNMLNGYFYDSILALNGRIDTITPLIKDNQKFINTTKLHGNDSMVQDSKNQLNDLIEIRQRFINKKNKIGNFLYFLSCKNQIKLNNLVVSMIYKEVCKFYSKDNIRMINTQRSTRECFLLALENTDLQLIKLVNTFENKQETEQLSMTDQMLAYNPDSPKTANKPKKQYNFDRKVNIKDLFNLYFNMYIRLDKQYIENDNLTMKENELRRQGYDLFFSEWKHDINTIANLVWVNLDKEKHILTSK